MRHDLCRDQLCLTVIALRKQERELVAADSEGLAAATEAPRDLPQHLIARGVAVTVVHVFERVHVDQAESDPEAVVAGLLEAFREPLLEVTVIAEARERVGERELHRLELPEDRALVEGERGQRADERRGQEG